MRIRIDKRREEQETSKTYLKYKRENQNKPTGVEDGWEMWFEDPLVPNNGGLKVQQGLWILSWKQWKLWKTL